MLKLLVASFCTSLFWDTNGTPLIPIRPGQLNKAKGQHGSSHLNTDALRKIYGKPLSEVNTPPEQEGTDGAFESDIRLTSEQKRELHGRSGLLRRRRKVVDSSKLWPNGVIVYEYENELQESLKDVIKQAIEHWQRLTCLRFIEYTPSVPAQVGHASRVIFSRGSGCMSRIGRMSSVQETHLNPNCAIFGSVVHEIGHVAGFYHEHSRDDRDTYVNIFYENVRRDMVNDFKINRHIRRIEPYDLGSVMHYGPKWFSVNRKNTIEPKDLDFIGVIGQRKGLSFMDAKTANDLYKCNAHCHTSKHCANGGYIGPNCQCVCPDGLTGDCTHVVKHDNCGGVLTGTSGSFNSPNYPQPYPNNLQCYWLISGPPGSTITLTFSDFEIEDDPQCGYDSVVIRAYGPDLAGAKFCDKGPSGTIEYPGNNLLVGMNSDDDYTFKGFQAKYTIK